MFETKKCILLKYNPFKPMHYLLRTEPKKGWTNTSYLPSYCILVQCTV